jgi:osmotically-inducible protein OsmY
VITTKMKATIFNNSTLKVNESNVETFKGVVQLSGLVRSQAARIGDRLPRQQRKLLSTDSSVS